MALTLKTLNNMGGSGSGPKLFTYGTTDNKTTVKGSGYFNGASDKLEVGDRIMIHASDADFDAHVSAVSGVGVVTIAAVDGYA